MQRISTVTRVLNKFGLGKDGFAGGGPPNATQLEPVWFDNVQEELANAIEDQGYVLDGLTLNQLSFALNNYSFSGNPALANGAQLYVSNLASIFFDTGSAFYMAPMSAFIVDTDNATFEGDLQIGSDSTDVLSVKSTPTFEQLVTLQSGASFGATSIVGTSNSTVTAGHFGFATLAPPPNNRELAAGTTNDIVYNRGGSFHFVHHSPNGWTYATGEQEADSGLAATNVSLVTAQRVTPQSINVLVIAEGWGQRSVAGDVTLQLQWDDGAGVYTDQGSSVNWSWVSTASATTWSYFRIVRRLTPNTAIDRLYRLKVEGNGGATAKIREATIRVVNPQR